MKIDRSRVKKSTSEVPVECQALIDKLRGCYNKELLDEFKKIDSWTFGKCELYHWIDILDISDSILEDAADHQDSSFILACDLPENAAEKELLLWVLHFTTLLIEHSFSRHLYSSMEHLITLLSSCDMNVVLGVLNLLYMFSKRSNFITRLGNEKRQALISRLTYLAESWGGKENGFGLAECSRESPVSSFPASCTTLHFEFYPDGVDGKPGTSKSKSTTSPLSVIRIENIDQQKKAPSKIMDELMQQFKIPEDRQMQLYTHIRLACSFADWPVRLLSVQARLQALSVLVYSNALADNAHTLLYSGILEELVELLELQYPYLMEIRAAALRTLTSIIHLDRNPHFPKKPGSRLNMIIDVTGANSYHGFLPTLVRTCIATLTATKKPVKADTQGPFPLPLATALFSFLYHLASYEAGGEALVSCGMMESLLRVINWLGRELEHITFVTRAVRVIDLITNIDMQAFQTHGGLSSFINRLEMEVKVCRREQPFEIIVKNPFNDENNVDDTDAPGLSTQDSAMRGHYSSDDADEAQQPEMDMPLVSADRASRSAERRVMDPPSSPISHYDRGETPESPETSFDRGEAEMQSPSQSSSDQEDSVHNASRSSRRPDRSLPPFVRVRGRDTLVALRDTPESPSTTFDRGEAPATPPTVVRTSPDRAATTLPDYSASKTGKTCLPQRAALLKSMLNFLKKAIQDQAFSDSIRHVMEGSLPASLKHIISNAEYYGPSLFLLATDVVTVYVFQEPSLLSSLQDNGLTDVVLHALLVKDVPATREVLGSLPNVFSALCLNARGLASFVTCEPFERLFKVLLSPTYLAAMRRRRSSDPMGDTASNLGNAMDELMRHQPILKVDATTAIIKLLDELCLLGRDPKYVCWRAQKGVDVAPTLATGGPVGGNAPTDTGSSDEEDDDEEEASTSSHPQREDAAADTGSANAEKTPIALIDYILNVMKFIDAILSNNSTDDHCKEFVRQNGLAPLLSILSLPNLPVDYPVTTAAQGVASVCKSILNLAHEPTVLKVGLTQLGKVLELLEPLHKPISEPGSSVLLHELATAPNLETAFSTYSSTPLLHAMGAAHGYVVMFVHVCRTGQSEIRTLSLVNWGSPTGLAVLRSLAKLYISLVWESTLLLALCSDDIIPQGCRFGSDDMDKLLPAEMRGETEPGPGSSSGSTSGSDSASNGMTSAMEALTTDPTVDMDVDYPVGSEKPKDSRAVPTAVQLKYIKPLLGASSRLGRALAELFGLLVKLCVGSPIRARRGQVIPNQPSLPSPSARAVAATLNELLALGLNFSKLPDTTIPKFKLTFLICSVGFTSPMLFDEKKYPYHLMLHKFVQQGGQSTFYECIRWALSADGTIDEKEGLEHPNLPDGTGEFLDACLTLLEKMVNPKAILDSPHTTSGQKSSTFDPLKYLLKTHQVAFATIMLMWGRKPLKAYGARMSESMLAILRHILRGEKILMERLSKEMISLNTATAEGGLAAAAAAGLATTSNTPLARRPPREVPDVNAEHLRQLMDMGFSREHCREALLSTSSVLAATDYLLMAPTAYTRVAQQNVSMDLDEEDQMVRAIAMSLGEKVTDKNRKDSPASPISRADQIKEDFESLSRFQSVIEDFTETALRSCLDLLDILPDTVYRICDLLVTISKRNGEFWRDDMLSSLMVEISGKVNTLLRVIENGSCAAAIVRELTDSETAMKTAGRIHLFTLLFEGPIYTELRIPCALEVQRSNITHLLVQLLYQSQQVMTESGETCTPKWMAPLLLLLDLLEKVSVCTKRKEQMHQVTNRVWRWFDLTAGKWTVYTQANNKLINDAYWNGEQAIRINCGRRRYTLQFAIMCQMNEESANRRPISMSLISREHAEGKGDKVRNDDKDKTDRMDVEEQTLNEKREKKHNVVIEGLGRKYSNAIIKSCVGLLAIPVDKDTLHAVMRLCLRITRTYEYAKTFAKDGGVKLLLDLSFYSSFTGFLSLTTLIIRHVIEDPATLRLSMEKVLRAKTLANIPPGYKELLYLLRNTSAAVTRDPEAFLEVARKVLRVDCNILVRRNEEEDNRLLVKTLPYRQNPAGNTIQGEVAINAIYQMLDALIKSYPRREEPPPPGNDSGHVVGLAAVAASLAIAQNPIQLVNGSTRGLPVGHSTFRTNAGNLLGVPDDGVREYEMERIRKAREEILNGRGTEDEKKRPLLPKSALLKLLAESVRSYAGCARLIADYVYRAGQSELVGEECTALAFLLDRLLPLSENPEDRECSTMARMLIAAIASCNHSPDAQTTLVAEVRCSLLRSVALPESYQKHVQIQLLAGLVSTMVDNCPPTPSVPISQTMKLHQYSNNMNNIVRIILRKGLLVDLARVSHNLDLSSPNMPATLNAILKPLETLSRIVNQPSAAPLVKAKPSVTVPPSSAGDQAGAAPSTAARAQGEEILEDADNSELDIASGAAEPALDSSLVQEEGDEAALQDIMDQLLEGVPQSATPQEIIDAQYRESQAILRSASHMDVDSDHISSHSGIQNSAPFSTDDDGGDIDQVEESDSSDSETNASDDAGEVHDVGDGEDDDDDEDDDGEDNEDEEEGGSGYDEEELEFFESDEGLFRIPGLDRENEDILMIQYTDGAEAGGIGSLVPWGSSSFPLPFGLFDDPYNGNENADVSNVSATHPLLMARHQIEIASMTTTRAQRANRQRRYQYLQLNPRNPNPPVILQRLLGPSTSQNVSTNPGHALASSFGDSRVVVMDNGLGIFTQNEEEQIDFVDQSGYLFGPSLAATLSNVPTALHWWSEEAKLLDGESQPACVTVIASELVADLEKFRDIELNERQEKRKQFLEKEAAKQETKSIDLYDDEEALNVSAPLLVSPDMIDIVSAEPETEPIQAEPTTDQSTSSREDGDQATGQSESDTSPEDVYTALLPEADQLSSPNRDPRSYPYRTARPASLVDMQPLEVEPESEGPDLVQDSDNEETLNDLDSGQVLDTSSETGNEDQPPGSEAAEEVDPYGEDFMSGDLAGSEEWYRTQSTSTIDPHDLVFPIRRVSALSETTSSTSVTTSTAVAGPSSSGATAEIPEGVDPSFLAALPEEMREEVIAEQLRLQRIRQRALLAAGEAEPAPLTEVNPEFLAALPPAIQEEVLAQQRQEQQRQAAIAANPDDPVDAAAFFENLQPSLRQAILTDMEESQIAALPPEIAQEAQSLRREWETRNRQLMQERFFSHVSHSSSALSSILRNSGAGRVGTRYAIHTVPQRAQWGGTWSNRPDPLPALPGEGTSLQGTLRLRGRQLLDHEAMSCLLVLLFVDEPKLNTGRLHRVLRNLCYHGPTRDWVIRALISIMARCNECRPPDPIPSRRRMATRSQNSTAELINTGGAGRNQSPSWLNISLDAALGCRASVFSVSRHVGKRAAASHIQAKGQDTINIHPQAAPIVFRHTLEVLISLAKSFPRYFLPYLKDVDSGTQGKDNVTPTKEGSERHCKSSSNSPRSNRSDQTDFWEMLVKLDSLTSKKGKSVARTHSSPLIGQDDSGNPSTFETSAFGQLIQMLSSSVVKRSCLLTDKLLRLLSLISIGLPDCHIYLSRLQPEEEGGTSKKQDQVSVPDLHLRLAIEVLTSKSCSEEGLEDATALLLNLANCPEPTREMILDLLLKGALELSNMVNEHIKALLQELKAMNIKMKGEDQNDSAETLAMDRERPNRGVLNDRFTKDSVVVSAPSKPKGGCDLQLPSMATLTSKTSSQAFFLRILKVITQIRESIRISNKNKRAKSPLITANTASSSRSTRDQDEGEPTRSTLPPNSTGTLSRQSSNTTRVTDTSDEPTNTVHSTPSNTTITSTDSTATTTSTESGTTTTSTTSTDLTDSGAMDTTDSSAPTTTSSSTTEDATLEAEAEPETETYQEEEPALVTLSEILLLDRLWETLSACLLELADTPDHHAVLVLQPAVEAFFLVHASATEEFRAYDSRDPSEQSLVQQPFDFDATEVAPLSPIQPAPDDPGQSSSTPERPTALNINWEVSPSPINLPPDQQKFLKFAETHRTVLNQILRQSTTHLADGPFAVLVDHTRVLDFDVKRRYFRSELERLDEGIRREELAVHVRRNNVFEDSFRELHRRNADEWKNRFYIVFEGEEGQDAGGLLREWYVIISREIFNPMYALFTTSPGDRVTYMINSTSHCNPNHLCYFKFVGRVIAKAIYDNKLLECYFTRSFYKHILGILVKYTDMETEDFSFYQGLVYLMENHVSTVGYELTFSTEVQEFGVTEVRDLIANGRNIFVSEHTKMDYIRLVCQMKMTGAIRKQINAFLEGFYDIIPKRLIAIFNEQELELLISGLPNVDIEDLRSNTEYHKYQPTSLQIQWFWRALRAFDQADRAKFLQFVTGTSKVPLQGFGALEGMNGVQKFQIHRDDRSTDRLPSAHTCFNQLDLPVYETYNKLNRYLQKAIHECSEGFGFA